MRADSLRRISLATLVIVATGLAAASPLLGHGAPQGPRDLVGRQFTARVVGIIDGDTVDLLIAPARNERIRLHGIDAPEAGEPYSAQARNFLRVLMFDRTVAVRGESVDVYGRLVARIAVDTTDAATAIVAAGLACTYRRYASETALDSAFARARQDRLGFWAPGAPQPKCVARELEEAPRAAPVSSATHVIGNVNSRVYHLPTCRNADCKNCTRKFATPQEAQKAGFRPAGDCIRE